MDHLLAFAYENPANFCLHFSQLVLGCLILSHCRTYRMEKGTLHPDTKAWQKEMSTRTEVPSILQMFLQGIFSHPHPFRYAQVCGTSKSKASTSRHPPLLWHSTAMDVRLHSAPGNMEKLLQAHHGMAPPCPCSRLDLHYHGRQDWTLKGDTHANPWFIFGH